MLRIFNMFSKVHTYKIIMIQYDVQCVPYSIVLSTEFPGVRRLPTG